MRLTRKTSLIIAVVCGLGAAILSAVYLLSLPKPAAVEPTVKMVPVVVATVDIPRHALISSDMVGLSQVAETEKPSGALSNLGDAITHLTVEPVVAGQPILASQIERRVGASLAYQVPPKMRAVTVAIDPVSGVAGFLKAGDRVDILATFDVEAEAITKTVLQDVQLLAIDERTAIDGVPSEGEEEGEAKPKAQASTTATVAVTPTQAQRLVLAASKGKILLTLRGPGDRALIPLAPSDTTSLVGVALRRPEEKETAVAEQPIAPGGASPGTQAALPPKAELTRDQKVVVIRGSEQEVVVP